MCCFVDRGNFRGVPARGGVLAVRLATSPRGRPCIGARVGRLVSRRGGGQSRVARMSVSRKANRTKIFIVYGSSLVRRGRACVEKGQVLLNTMDVVLFVTKLAGCYGIMFAKVCAQEGRFSVVGDVKVASGRVGLVLFKRNDCCFVYIVKLLFAMKVLALIKMGVCVRGGLSCFAFR